MDLVIKLREARRRAGISQQEASERSRIGVKTISSFESGARIDSMKLSQLERLLTAYGIGLAEFFSPAFDHQIAPWDLPPEDAAIAAITERLRSVPLHHRLGLAEKILLMLDGVAAVLTPTPRSAGRPSASIH